MSILKTPWDRIYWIVAVNLAALGCGGSQGTDPHDMSSAEHEATAGQEAAASAEHAEQARTDVKTEAQMDAEAAAWLSTTNPSKEHKEEAARHRKLAAEHRAAAKALRDAEAKECTGLSPDDRDMSPFYHREDIASVSKIEHEVQSEVQRGNVKAGQVAGGRAVFRAVPGMTAEWLQRLVDCHMARAAALGHNVPEMSYCPLMLKGVQATVASAGTGFAIDVTADDSKTAEEIWRRMQALGPAR